MITTTRLDSLDAALRTIFCPLSDELLACQLVWIDRKPSRCSSLPGGDLTAWDAGVEHNVTGDASTTRTLLAYHETVGIGKAFLNRRAARVAALLQMAARHGHGCLNRQLVVPVVLSAGFKMVRLRWTVVPNEYRR